MARRHGKTREGQPQFFRRTATATSFECPICFSIVFRTELRSWTEYADVSHLSREDRAFMADEGINHDVMKRSYLLSCGHCGFSLELVESKAASRLDSKSWSESSAASLAHIRELIDKCQPVEGELLDLIKKRYSKEAYERRLVWIILVFFALSVVTYGIGVPIEVLSTSNPLGQHSMYEKAVFHVCVALLGLFFVLFSMRSLFRAWRSSRLRRYIKAVDKDELPSSS